MGGGISIPTVFRGWILQMWKEKTMTNDNSKCPDCGAEGAHFCVGKNYDPNKSSYRLSKPFPSEPKCEHSDYNKWAYHEEQDGGIYILQYVYKDKYPRCPFCKPVEPSSKHESWCNWHKDNRLCSCKPVVCNVVEPSVEEISQEMIEKLQSRFPLLSRLVWYTIKLAMEEALRNERNRK